VRGSVSIRPLRADDLPRLPEIDTRFVSDAVLRVDKSVQGLRVVWNLYEVALAQAFERPNGYYFTNDDLALTRRRMEEGHSLQLVAETANHVVGFIDVEHQAWNHTSMIWNILIDHDYRRQGLGRCFVERAAEWARQRGCRALTLETQNNNISACRFYWRMGFRLTGIRDDFYHNDDLARGEVAIFWSLSIDRPAGDSREHGA